MINENRSLRCLLVIFYLFALKNQRKQLVNDEKLDTYEKLHNN